MDHSRQLDPKFLEVLQSKEPELQDLFHQVRELILEICPAANELLYHTHALTDVFSINEKLSGGFCHLPIYQQHLNLGFNQGAKLPDPKGLLQGTGKAIRHVPIRQASDLETLGLKALVSEAIIQAMADQQTETMGEGKVISKIKK